MAMRFLERHDNGELDSPPSCYQSLEDLRADEAASEHCKPSCRMAAFKARADRTALPGLLEDELFRVPFE